MNRIGRRKTVLLSLIVTFVSLLLPIFGDSYGLMLCSFPLLMGFASDAAGQGGAVAVMTVGVIYLLIYMFRIRKEA